MKKLYCCLACCVAFIFIATSAQGEKQPEMMCSVPFFIEQYNKTAPDLGLSFLNEKAVKDKSGVMETHQIFLTRYSVVTMTSNPGRGSLTSLIFNGAGDGSQQSGMLILASLLNTVSAILNEYTPDELKVVFDQLGLFDPSGKIEPQTVATDHFIFSISSSESAGLILSVKPGFR